MPSIRHEFVNENERAISILVTSDQRGVTVRAFTPEYEVEHTWTPLEAKVLRMLLELLEPARKARVFKS